LLPPLPFSLTLLLLSFLYIIIVVELPIVVLSQVK
jgi:hypothetical protein